MSLIDSLSRTMTTAQVYRFFNGDISLLVAHMEVCSVGNRLALLDLISNKYKEQFNLERPEIENQDVINELRGYNGL